MREILYGFMATSKRTSWNIEKKTKITRTHMYVILHRHCYIKTIDSHR